MRIRGLAIVVLALSLLTLSPTLASAGLSTGGGQWHWQNPLPQGNDLCGLAFSDPVSGVAVGQAGTVLVTANGGANWRAPSTGTSETLYAVSVVGTAQAWAVGANGTIVHSSDGGATWAPQSSGSVAQLGGVTFTDALSGWAVGASGTVIRTADGGATWASRPSGVSAGLTAVRSPGPDIGVAVGATGTIVRTVDGGSSWVRPASGTTKNLAALTFVDAATGWAVGDDGTLLKTTNGGASWLVRSPSGWSWIDFKAVAFTDATHGYIAGTCGKILRTADGGATWSGEPWGPGAELKALAVSGSHGVAVGSSGVILLTADAGAMWGEVSCGIGDWEAGQLRAVDFAGDRSGWAASKYGAILATTDGGGSWRQQAKFKECCLNDIDMASTAAGWAVGSTGAGASAIVRTADGGSSWQAQVGGVTVVPPAGAAMTGLTSSALNGVAAVDAQTAWAVGDGGKVVRTSDGGTTWLPQASGVTQALNDVSFTDASNGWAVGEGGTILHTGDAGVTWVSQRSGVTVAGTGAPVTADTGDSGFSGSLAAVDFVDVANGWAVGYDWYLRRGVVLRTRDGGVSWTLGSVGADVWLNDVSFVSTSTGRVAGDDGALYATADGGVTWVRESSGTERDLCGLSSLDATRAWAVGSGYAVLSTVDVVTPPLAFTAAPADGRITLSWRNPAEDSFARTRLVRSEAGYPAEPTPTVGQVALYEGPVATFDDTGLANGTDYYYAAFSQDASGTYSAAATASAWPGLPTTLSAWSSKGLVDYNGATTVWGELVKPSASTSATALRVKTGGGDASTVPVPDRTDIAVWRSFDHGQTWSPDGTAVWDAAAGKYKAWRLLTKNTKFQFRFAGDRSSPNFLLPSRSGWVWVECKAPVTRPVAPAAVRRNVAFTASGLVRVRRAKSVKVVFARVVRRHWVKYRAVEARRRYYSTYTRYSVRLKVPHRGRWYVKAYYVDDLHAATWTSRRYFKVR